MINLIKLKLFFHSAMSTLGKNKENMAQQGAIFTISVSGDGLGSCNWDMQVTPIDQFKKTSNSQNEQGI